MLARTWRKGNLVPWWWECRWVQPPWKTVWGFLKNLKMELPFDPVISLLGIYPKNLETPIWKNICPFMFIATLLTIAKIWKQPMSRWVDKNSCDTISQWNTMRLWKRGNFYLCDSMDGPGEHYAKWNKPVREWQIPYDLSVESDEQGKLINKRETVACILGTDWQLSEGRGNWMKEGEGISQRTYTHKPWPQTTVWWGPEGRGQESGWRQAEEGKMGTSVIVWVIKILKLKNKLI